MGLEQPRVYCIVELGDSGFLLDDIDELSGFGF